MLLDDPSDKVRAAMAEALSFSAKAPAQIIEALAGDQPHVAAFVLGRSPLLTEADLVDRLVLAPGVLQAVIASRAGVGIQLAAAIAEVGEREGCLALLSNGGAEIGSVSFHRMIERFGSDDEVCHALLGSARLPADCRHRLVVRLGEKFSRSPLLTGVVGERRAERIARDACTQASLTLIDHTRCEDHAVLVEHLRSRGDLTGGFLVRAVAQGNIDFFGAVLIALTGQNERRVRALLARGRDVALQALMQSAGLSQQLHGAIISALRVWREVANGRRVAGTQEVSWTMLQALRGEGNSELALLLRRIHLDALRSNARGHARMLAAA
jgi:uncharacterized protein (DUF2336 family)